MKPKMTIREYNEYREMKRQQEIYRNEKELYRQQMEQAEKPSVWGNIFSGMAICGSFLYGMSLSRLMDAQTNYFDSHS